MNVVSLTRLSTLIILINQVLDATFDNLLPLATARMPASLETLVTVAIENFMNLNVIDHLKVLVRIVFIRLVDIKMILAYSFVTSYKINFQRFNGPVSLIRRSYDEIITTQR